MRKTITKIICLATAAISAAGLALSGCANWSQTPLEKDDYTTVSSNGGFAVETDNYVYFINGVESNSADNTFGTPLKGSIQRISVENVESRNYHLTETVVPVIAYSTHYQAGIYIYGDRIYYSTPSTARNSSGEVLYSNLEFKSSALDGSETMSDYYYRASSSSLEYRYVRPEADGDVYLLYALSESLYGESSAVTNIHSINTTTGEDTLLAYNVADYAFDTEDPANPYVFYTMNVIYNLGSNNSITESYNQLWMVRADDNTPNTYDFSYVDDYNAEENPLYVNCGTMVYDGIGMLEYSQRYSQFNYGYGSGETYSINRTATTYVLDYYKNGVLTFNVQQSLDSSAALCMITPGEADSDWNAITANDNLSGRRLLIADDDVDYTFVTTAEGEDDWVLYNGETGLELGKFSGGVLSEEFALTDSGTATILAIRTERIWDEVSSTVVEMPYVYYSLSGGTGHTIYRIGLSSNSDNYRPNMFPVEENAEYVETRILDLDADSSWYDPEFVCGNTILFASETEGMTDYNYIMACNIGSEKSDSAVMSNAELQDYNEKYEAISEEIDAYDEETNSDGSAAYENLTNALYYAFYTGDREYLADLINAYVEIEDRYKEYLYSERSAEIYLEFIDATGDWADYADDVREVNGEEVAANRQQYYYALIGRMTEADSEALTETFRSTYMQAYPVDTSTWWDDMGTAWQIVFIVAMCVVGLAVIAGAVILTIWLVRRHKNKGEQPKYDKKKDIDITDDKNINVYEE